MSGEQEPNGHLNGSRDFQVLDEISNESDTADSYSSDTDVPDDEIERMLEDALQKKKRTWDEAGLDDGEQPLKEKDKVVLIERGHSHFDVLPEHWVQVTHNSGMHLYLHKLTRVCTLSKPYFLGPEALGNTTYPSAPFLSELRPRPRFREEQAEGHDDAGTPERQDRDRLGGHGVEQSQSRTAARVLPASVRVQDDQGGAVQVVVRTAAVQQEETAREAEAETYIARRNETNNLPDPPDRPSSGGGLKKEWIMNPDGKSCVCILHEYVQHALKKQPTYKFTELENAATLYAATVSINDMKYGVGYGTSKKQAKSEAAKATLEILIPEMRSKIMADAENPASSASRDHDLSFFDEIRIEDPRVTEFCAKTTEPSPHDILLMCLQRNFGLGDQQITYQGHTLKHQKNEFTMTVGKHTATVTCRNKREGKQRASQAILQALHPHITNWGSILRLYGNRSIKTFKEKKLEEQEITLLQSKAAVNSPNFAILDKLKLELGKLRDKRDAVQPIGPFVPNENEALPNLSSSNLKNVDL